jgi:dienelactone hydrolase
VAVALLGMIGGVLLMLWLNKCSSREVTLPQPSGAYAVGRAAFDWVDDSRPAVVDDPESTGAARVALRGSNRSKPPAHRELMVWLWYPAVSGASQPAAYLPGKWGDELQRMRGSLISQRLVNVRAHAVSSAPIAESEPAFPVLILSTGYGGVPADYTVLAEDLASHGYMVAGIANTWSAPVVVFPDGRVQKRKRAGAIPRGSAAAEQKTANRLVLTWAGDVVFVIDQLDDLNADPGQAFYGRIDTTRVGLLGHSFGGAASVEACSMDSRCLAAVDIDGWLYGDVAKVGLERPFMLILSDPSSHGRPFSLLGHVLRRFGSSRQQADEAVNAIYNQAPSAYKLVIGGTRHFNFSDSALLFDPLLHFAGMLGPIDGERGLRITSEYVTAFFDKYLKNADSPLIRNTASPYAEVQFQSHTGANGLAPGTGDPSAPTKQEQAPANRDSTPADAAKVVDGD